MKKTLPFIFIISLVLLTNVYPQSGWFHQDSGAVSTFYRSVHFVNNNMGWVVGGPGTIIKTNNGGTNWFSQTSGTGQGLFTVFFLNINTGWTAGTPGVIRKTINSGINWLPQTSLSGETITSIFFGNENTGWYVTSPGGSICKTINGGTNWILQFSTLGMNSIYCIDANSAITVGAGGIILRTFNGGTNWISQNSGTTQTLSSVYFSNSNVGWVVGSNLILKTINGGTNWISQNSGVTNSLTSIFFVNANIGWIVGYGGIILKTINGGTNWISQNSGTFRALRSVFFTDANTGWAVGDWGTILKTVTGGVTNIYTSSNQTPYQYSLYNNYPNPFNPSTKIKFDIPKSSYVKLIVYDILGREIQTLVNEKLDVGSYEVDLDATGYTSGVYFYKLETDEFVDVKKMVLMK